MNPFILLFELYMSQVLLYKLGGTYLDLTKEQCLIGFKKSLENALALIEDSKILNKKGSHGHSVALSMLALEECGKAMTLIAVYLEIKNIDKELLDIFFRKHAPKIHLSLLELALSKEDIAYTETLAPTLDLVKQRGFYVDYIKGKWATPQDDDLDKMAKINLDYAERIYESVKAYSKIK